MRLHFDGDGVLSQEDGGRTDPLGQVSKNVDLSQEDGGHTDLLGQVSKHGDLSQKNGGHTDPLGQVSKHGVLVKRVDIIQHLWDRFVNMEISVKRMEVI